MAFGLCLYIVSPSLLLCYSHRCPFGTKTRTFCRVSADSPESVLSGAADRVYASCACYFRGNVFPASFNRTHWIHQMDYCGVVPGCNLFFSGFGGIYAV